MGRLLRRRRLVKTNRDTQSLASLAAARVPPVATRLPRRRAWLRIFVVRCSLPCDPPLGGHPCNGRSYHASIARSVTRPRFRKAAWGFEMSISCPLCPLVTRADMPVGRVRVTSGLMRRSKRHSYSIHLVSKPERPRFRGTDDMEYWIGDCRVSLP